jgi:hypothetical protein
MCRPATFAPAGDRSGGGVPRADQVGRKRERFRLGQVFGLVDASCDALSACRCGAAPAF